MEFCSYFVPEYGIFGAYPNTNRLLILKELGVSVLIDLTVDSEISSQDRYDVNSCDFLCVKYPIKDHSTPTDWASFASLIIYTCDLIKAKKTIYIHCRGGHGRSGLLVACILRHMYGYESDVAIQKTTEFHGHRTEMREKWRLLGSPQTQNQKKFVFKFFSAMTFSKAYKTGTKAGFSMFSKHPIKLAIGTFNTIESAFFAYKAPNNTAYVEKIRKQVLTRRCAEIAALQPVENQIWEQSPFTILCILFTEKYSQHPDLVDPLIQTGLRYIVDLTRCAIADNLTGKCLMRIREFYFRGEQHYFPPGLINGFTETFTYS